ncbi:hypothetical protein MVLG_00832 [Microbotryum lychnidis-dioicae p1A1 Lamole]|uniref:Partial AB-hydrolase lipase domain-containing protein n=1 Tax=Microbotryum lychnidis-dioicae (strain p1A1 Lamole / MvSl-1064) TaxID=683840 RepID=U5H095_USTV1|nr:hypothetical protein MVLG_00832 [Microbotryum lychnidis-dioicae p1A1 Lamole]|eukprot:KDE09117.1 hypothetical protein MVLG_00832 [Microbotryum lychnidis-dioicae p1A1 Lamole]
MSTKSSKSQPSGEARKAPDDVTTAASFAPPNPSGIARRSPRASSKSSITTISTSSSSSLSSSSSSDDSSGSQIMKPPVKVNGPKPKAYSTPTTPVSQVKRGGSPHELELQSARNGLAPLSNLGNGLTAALDLHIPQPTIEVGAWPVDRFIDKGYSEMRGRSRRKTITGPMRLNGLPSGLTGDAESENLVLRQDDTENDEDDDSEYGEAERAQRSYLSGPTEELVESLPRPSPLPRYTSPLPSPALSTTSTSSLVAVPIIQQPADGTQLSFLDSTPSRPRPRTYTLSHSAFGSFGTFPSTARSGPLPAPTLISRIRLFFLQLLSNAASTAFLILIVTWALGCRAWFAVRRWLKGIRDVRERRPWDTDEMRAKYANEQVVRDIQYYARECGFDCIEQTVQTKDGYLLKVFRVECLNKKPKVHSDGRRGFPVLIQHGLFQSCGSFITSEERSLAFWLAEHGDYQVYLGNNRGVFDMGHVRLKRSDPRFWDYNIKELALYDLPAMVDHVRRETGYDKIAFIGHSQGNATMFCSLAQGMVPELGEKLSVFIALAPAVYAGPLTTGFPFGALKSMKWKTWRRWFGVLDFIPLMRISYNLTPSKPFGLLGYQMFAFLFNWTDRNWLNRRKSKMFRFTPSPVSSASIFWWTGYGGFSTRGCVLDPNVDKWFDHRFPPLAIHHGSLDYLVLTEPLLERLREKETDVKVIRVQKLDQGEHCDFFWHIDAVELCFNSFLEDIERTRPRYPEELSAASKSDAPRNSNGRLH